MIGATEEAPLERRRGWTALLGATALFGAALQLRDGGWIWWGTLAAATGSIALVRWAAPGQLSSLARPRTREVGVGLLAAFAMAIATYVAYVAAERFAPDLVTRANALYVAIDAPPGRVASLPIVALAVFAEELVWRGLGVALVSRRGRRVTPTFLLATGLYVLPQLLGGSLVLVLVSAAAGGVWTAQRMLGGNLTVSFVTHLVWDVLVFVVFPLDRL